MIWNIKHYESVDSTQSLARKLATDGAPEGTVVVALHQSEGRGRRGRTWYSPLGAGLWATFILRPDIRPSTLPMIPLMLSVAVARAVEKGTGSIVSLKWPNDIYMGGRKIGGVLCETGSSQSETPEFVLAGLGLNLVEPAEGYPIDIADRASSLEAESGIVIERERMLASVLDSITEIYSSDLTEGFPPSLIEEASRRDILKGRKVTIRIGDRTIEGISEGLSGEGGLLLRTGKEEKQEIKSGEVIRVTPPS